MKKVWLVYDDDGECRHVVAVCGSKDIADNLLKLARIDARTEWEERMGAFEVADPKFKRPGYTSDLDKAVIEEREVL